MQLNDGRDRGGKRLNRIKKYLKQFTDQLVFINLESQLTQSKKDISFLKDIPIPVSVETISKHVKKEDIDKIPFEAFVQGMIYVMGVDKDFKYFSEYKRFLYLSNDKIIDYMLYHGLKLADENRYLDAIVYLRAVISMEDSNLSALYNYGKCCGDIFDLSKDLDEKKRF